MNRRLIFMMLMMVLAVGLAACGGAAPVVDSNGSADEATDPAPPVEEPTTEPPTAESPADVPATEVPATEVSPTDAPPTAEPAAEILCPEVARPAIMFVSGDGFELQNPLTGDSCPLELPDTIGYPQATAGTLYAVDSDYAAGSSVVSRSTPDGFTPLEDTRVKNDVHYLLRFAAAEDDSRLAWTRMVPGGDQPDSSLSGSLWIAGADGSQTTIFEDLDGGQQRIISPIRFSADAQTLFYTWEPIGLGGAWNAFNGRYDNLWRVAAAGGEPEKVFDCADEELFLCLGDFTDEGALAYIDLDRVVHVRGPDGAAQAAIPTSGQYAGYPTFSPDGDLYYSDAELAEPAPGALPLPEPGTVYRVAAPYDGQPEVVASTSGLLLSALRDPFLDAGHVLASYTVDEQWGAAVLSAAGDITPLEPFPNAYPAAVWPE